jgi:hypothetical protein
MKIVNFLSNFIKIFFIVMAIFILNTEDFPNEIIEIFNTTNFEIEE